MDYIQNDCRFEGNIGRMESSVSSTGAKRVNFSLAVTMPRKVDDTWENETQWVNLTAYGRLAENIEKNVPVKAGVVVRAIYRTNRVEGDEGVRIFHNFIAQTVRVVRWPNRDGDSRQENSEGEPDYATENDIPF